MSERDEELNRVNECVKSLGEHFDTVQIFVSRHDHGEDKHTLTISLGAGNWYARYGQIVTWVKKCDEESRKEVRESD